MLLREHVAEDRTGNLGQDRSQGGQAGTDNGSVDLGARPVGDGNQIPRGVSRVEKRVEKHGAHNRNKTHAAVLLAQTQCRDPWSVWNSQKTHGEDDEKAGFLLSRDRHGNDHGNGNKEDDEVGDDVNVGQRPPDGVWMAVPWYRRVPHLGQWNAHGEGHGEAPSVVSNYDGECHPDDLADVLGRQNAEVEQQDRDLGAA